MMMMMNDGLVVVMVMISGDGGDSYDGCIQ